MAAKKKKDGSLTLKDELDPELATGTTDPDVQLKLINQVLVALRSDDDTNKIAQIALLQMQGIAPKDTAESMLAVQMVATHDTAMKLLKQAMLANQTFQGKDMNLKHAEKLLQLYSRQMEVLAKYRGKGQQKITVEHVTVQAGGQAIVGNVTSAAAEASRPAPAKPMLAHEQEEFMPMVKDITPAKRPSKTRTARSGSGEPE
jgi:hypothetical protein